MAKIGRSFSFHGAFKTKADAKRKERRTPGSFIKRYGMRGIGVRYVVVKSRRKRGR